MLEVLKKLFAGKPAVNYRELAENGALIIDVRSVAEYNAGHIKKSLNIPLNTISGQVAKLKKANKPVIAVCQSGSRSSMATGILKRAGIEAYNGGSWYSLQNKIA